MDRLLVVSRVENIGAYYRDELRLFFDNAIEIDCVSANANNLQAISDYDLILITTHTIVEDIMRYVKKGSRVLKVIKGLHPNGMKELDKIPYGSEALVVNVGPKTVSESIYLIYAYGRSDLELHPYYPGIENYKKLDIILTQGELGILPQYGGEVVDMFNTILDSKTLLEIISFFKLDKKKFLNKLMERSKIRNYKSDGVSLVINERFMFEQIINVMFENLNEGVLIFDNMGVVTSNSVSIQSFLNKASHNVFGEKITELIPVDEKLLFGKEVIETIIQIKNVPLICNIMPKLSLGSNDYGLVILKKYNDAEMKIHMFKKELISKGHKTKYCLNDIVGASFEMSKIKDIALRMAKSDTTVLIMGESGTGKELFAHVIHNNSRRKKEQFVAFNCSAISESLLESELFGYEDGAFTGAKKGGKIGLFEIANGGTLFLDEIGEMPLHLQNRLLRVLQEKEIMKVGSNSIRSIDVRIIAATNIDMKKQVEAGNFRKDLYYRLSVLPINIPPLRRREGDVLLIFDKMNRDKGSDLILSEETKDFFLSYHWDGNVRELYNCFEYLLNLGKMEIELDDLPENMRNTTQVSQVIRPIKVETTDSRLEILKLIYHNNSKNVKVGRKSISDALRQMHIFLGEQEVRTVLLELQSASFVIVTKGRGGTKITSEGIAYLQKNNCINCI